MDIDKIRSETPGCAHVSHFNNAGSALMPQPVIDAQQEYLTHEINYGGYEAAEKFAGRLKDTYANIAELIHAKPHEIAVVESATVAWGKAFFSINFQPGDRIVTAMAEYASNYINYLQVAKTHQIEIEVIANDEHGQISVKALEELLEEDKVNQASGNAKKGKIKLISITHIPTNGGLVNPAEKVGKLAKKHGILYLLDACQSVGQMPVDVQKIGCDMLSATGRKYLRAPRGTGFLYVSENIMADMEPKVIDMTSAEWVTKDSYTIRPDAIRFENFEYNHAAKAGLSAAVKYALDLGIDNIWKRTQYLANLLRQNLTEIPNIIIQDLGEVKCGIVSLSISGIKTDFIKQKLKEKNINISLTSESGTLLDMQDRKLNQMIRASVHYYNTEKEIDIFCGEIKKIILLYSRIEH